MYILPPDLLQIPLSPLFPDHQSLWPDISPLLSRYLQLTDVPIRYPSITHPIIIKELKFLFLPANKVNRRVVQPLTSFGSELGCPSRNVSVQPYGVLDGPRSSFHEPFLGSENSFPKSAIDNEQPIRSDAVSVNESDESVSADQETSTRLTTGVTSFGSTASNVQGEATKNLPSFKSLADKPYLGIYFFQVDSIEAFRTQHRKNVKAWIDHCIEQQVEWMLALVTTISESSTQEKLVKRFCDKLRSEALGVQDAKAKTKDRFVRICTGKLGSPIGSRPKECIAAFEESWTVSCR